MYLRARFFLKKINPYVNYLFINHNFLIKIMYSDRRLNAVDEYIRKLSGQERESLGVSCDHNYVKPWYAHTDSHRTKPAKLLFMNSVQRPKSTYTNPDEEIDVVNDTGTENQSLFDSPKTKVLAYELERSLKCNLNIDADISELDDFPVENYSFQKMEIYREVMELINADILAKVVYSGRPHEFIKRKITTEKCARELRIIFANTFYDFDIILWIHRLILDKGNLLSITSYLNILQALSTKIPTIVDKILKSYSGSLGYEYLCQILRKQWDPVPVLNQHKLRKLPGNPYLLLCCAGFNASKAMDKSPRFKFWLTNLNTLCKTAYIPVDFNNKSTFEETLDNSLITLTNKIIESKNHFPKRPVILAGWNIGALIACHAALGTAVDAVICFGFPLTGVNGSQGGLNDPLLECKVPILFIIGQNSNMCSTDDIEDFRSRMGVESGLIIVGGSDDFLCISPQKMQLEGITQEIVDRCILDEISDFLQSTLVKMPPTQFSFKKGVDDSDEVSYNDQSKRKRKRQPYSPEKIATPKRLKITVPKEATETSPKSYSPGSSKKSRHHGSRKAKEDSDKFEDKRSPIKPLRIKIPKPVVAARVDRQKIAEKEALLKRKLADSILLEDLAPKPAARKLPFALNILPKKNEPVDVVKAFGNDCSFLPQPFDDITADNPFPAGDTLLDAPIPAEQVQKTNEPEASSIVSQHIESSNTNVATLAPEIIPSVESCVPSSATSNSSKSALGSNALLGPATSSSLSLASSSKTGMSVFATPSVFKTVTKDDKVLTPTSIGPLKNICTEKPASSLNQATSSGSRKSIITVPSTAAALLFSGKTLKTPSGKFLQVLTKGPVPLKAKSELAPQLVGSSYPKESIVPSSNLSLLSNASTVVTEHSSIGPKKIETNSSATLVKLAALPSLQKFKPVQKFRPSSASSFPVKAETPAEMAEKQRAILELNKSLNLETVTSANKINEPGYTICYTKPDGSIISRKIIKPPIHTTVRHSNPFL